MIYIVGNGLFGRIAHDMLRANNIESIIIDSDKSGSGTSASGNITKPSWVSGLGDLGKQAYKDLDKLYGLEKFSPEIAFGKSIDLYYVPRTKILNKPHLIREVTEVGDGQLKIGEQILQGKVLVAAGVWSGHLVPMPVIDNVKGVSFIFKEPSYKPKFSVWAPYKQAISYGHDSEVWFGDGTAIKEKNWDVLDRIAESLKRAQGHGLKNPIQVNVGNRPYVKGHKDGYFKKVYDNTWVSTGGGKNGIVLAAIQARKFLEAITIDR